MDASEINAGRLNAKEVLTSQNVEMFLIPIADGTIKLFGGDQILRTTTFDTGSSNTEEKIKEIFKENHTDFLQLHFKTHRWMMVKQEMISGPCQGTTFTVITWETRVKLYMPREESLPNSTTIH